MVDATIVASAPAASSEDETPASAMESEIERRLPPMQSLEGTPLKSMRHERSAQAPRSSTNIPVHEVDEVDDSDTGPPCVVDASTLPSTVPESLYGGPIPHSEPLPLEPMDNPNAATQELSDSEMDNIVAQSRSRIHGDETTQLTLKIGDEGHIDLLSGLVPILNGNNDGNDNNEDDDGNNNNDDAECASPGKAPSLCSSPKTQKPMSQFPESQRFKTPAIAGKKRDHLGNTKDTPDLPRPNFDLPDTTPGHLIRLSQVFDATQAHTSPISVAIAHPLSDRPSPNADIEIRPAMTTSPTMRPLSEPDVSYVPMAQSQAKRHQRASSNFADDVSDDDLSDETSLIERKRREQARWERIIKTPSLPSKTRRRASPTPPPNLASQLQSNRLDLNDSDAETDQADESDNDGHRPDQLTPGSEIDVQHKENDQRMVVQIPHTATRLPRAISNIYSDKKVTGSPSPAVATTQCPQSTPRSPAKRKSSTNNDIEYVPQSQANPESDPVTQLRSSVNGTVEGEASSTDQPQSQSLAQPQVNDTVPESSPSKQPRISNVETAPSRLSPESSPRSAFTKARNRRKQMEDISAGPSSQVSSYGFDPVPALNINSEQPADLGLSTIQVPVNSSTVGKARIVGRMESRTARQIQEPKSAKEIPLQDHVTSSESPHECAPSSPVPIDRPYSGLRRKNPSRTTRTRGWDLEVSPAKPLSRPQGRIRPEIKSRKSRVSRPIFTTARDVKKSQLLQHEAQIETAPQKADKTDTPFPSAPPVTTSKSDAPLLTPPPLSDLPMMVERPHPPKAAPSDCIVAPDMVFAFFNGKPNGYYPARCLQKVYIKGDRVRYSVQWDGFPPSQVNEFGIRALDLQVGDQVRIAKGSFAKLPYVVWGFKDKVAATDLGTVVTDIRGFRTICVSLKQRESLHPDDMPTEVTKEVPIADIYLTKTMWGKFENRAHGFRPQLDQPVVSTPGTVTPVDRFLSPSSRLSRITKPDALNTSALPGIFTNMVFAISNDIKDTKDAKNTKDTLVRDIQDHGGTIIEASFTELLQSETIVALKPEYQSRGFTALLAHDFSRKAKYMEALALGLPCLSYRWISDSINREGLIVDWHTYLLPAGQSDALNGAIRSQVLRLVDPLNVKLADMLQSRSQPLAKMKVAAVITKGSKSKTERIESYIFLLYALGAASVLKFTSVKAAKQHIISMVNQKSSSSSSDDVDDTAAANLPMWLFVDDEAVEDTSAELGGHHTKQKNKTKTRSKDACRVTAYGMIVQSVILGKMYPF